MNRILVSLKRTQPYFGYQVNLLPKGHSDRLWADGWGSLGAVTEGLHYWHGQALFCGPCWAVAALCALCKPHVKSLRFGEPGPRKVHPQTRQLFLGISAHSLVMNIKTHVRGKRVYHWEQLAKLKN